MYLYMTDEYRLLHNNSMDTVQHAQDPALGTTLPMFEMRAHWSHARWIGCMNTQMINAFRMRHWKAMLAIAQEKDMAQCDYIW